MPLIRNAKLSDALHGVDFRRRDELARKDYIRTFRGGMDVSLRTLSRPQMAVFNALQELAEDEIILGDDHLAAFVNSQTALCVEMSKMFWKTRSVGVAPSARGGRNWWGLPCSGEGRELFIEPGTVWYPVCAAFMAYEIVVLFRVWQQCEDTVIDEFNSTTIGITVKDLGSVFPELETYVRHIQNKASEMETVKDSLKTLIRWLRPREAGQQEAIERAARYQDVEHFGSWG